MPSVSQVLFGTGKYPWQSMGNIPFADSMIQRETLRIDMQLDFLVCAGIKNNTDRGRKRCRSACLSQLASISVLFSIPSQTPRSSWNFKHVWHRDNAPPPSNFEVKPRRHIPSLILLFVHVVCLLWLNHLTDGRELSPRCAVGVVASSLRASLPLPSRTIIVIGRHGHGGSCMVLLPRRLPLVSWSNGVRPCTRPRVWRRHRGFRCSGTVPFALVTVFCGGRCRSSARYCILRADCVSVQERARLRLYSCLAPRESDFSFLLDLCSR